MPAWHLVSITPTGLIQRNYMNNHSPSKAPSAIPGLPCQLDPNKPRGCPESSPKPCAPTMCLQYTSSRPTRSSQNPPSLTVKQMAEHHGELEILISLDILRADLSEGLKARIGKHHMSPNTTWSDQ
ncbi:hypothetical protein PSTT_02349 [Puccinia striiformis]|uniref:Uncharacterized protein n=1 Tax=Puccinia striiformis TaxID=27350 RepID=A0A2S4W059_9BASI|nr:hypothetical protein PSTT_02349 [Puccinia striiformis]